MLRLGDGEAEAGLVNLLRTTMETATDAKMPFRKPCKQKPCSYEVQINPVLLNPCLCEGQGIMDPFRRPTVNTSHFITTITPAEQRTIDEKVQETIALLHSYPHGVKKRRQRILFVNAS